MRYRVWGAAFSGSAALLLWWLLPLVSNPLREGEPTPGVELSIILAVCILRSVLTVGILMALKAPLPLLPAPESLRRLEIALIMLLVPLVLIKLAVGDLYWGYYGYGEGPMRDLLVVGLIELCTASTVFWYAFHLVALPSYRESWSPVHVICALTVVLFGLTSSLVVVLHAKDMPYL